MDFGKQLENIKNNAIDAGVTKESWEEALKKLGKTTSAEDKIKMLTLMSEGTLQGLLGPTEGGIVHVHLQLLKMKIFSVVKSEQQDSLNPRVTAEHAKVQAPILVNPKFDVPKIDECENITRWVRSLKQEFQSNRVTDESQMIGKAMKGLSNDDRQLVEGEQDSTVRKEFPAFIKFVRNLKGATENSERQILKVKLYSRVQQNGESVLNVFNDIKAMINDLAELKHDVMPNETDVQDMIQHTIRAMGQNQMYRGLFQNKRFQDWKEFKAPSQWPMVYSS